MQKKIKKLRDPLKKFQRKRNRRKMNLPEFCKFLDDENYCDDIECEQCPIDRLMLEDFDFKIEKINKEKYHD